MELETTYTTIQEAQIALAKKEITLGEYRNVQAGLLKKNKKYSFSNTNSKLPESIELLTPESTTLNNNNSNSQTMSKKSESTTENPTTESAEVQIDSALVEKIKALDCKKHVKIYKLSQLGMTNKQIATHLSTNPGAIYNNIKLYKNEPDRVKKADEIVVE